MEPESSFLVTPGKSSVEASDALRILEQESGLKSVSLTEVQRQTNSLYREAVKTMRHSPEEGFAQLEKLGAIREVSIFDRGQIVAELYREFRAEGRETLVVAALMLRFPNSPTRFARIGKNTANWESAILLIGTSRSSGRRPETGTIQLPRGAGSAVPQRHETSKTT